MTTAPIAPSTLSLSDTRGRIDRTLHTFMLERRFDDPRLNHAVSLLHDFVLRGGKRVRPLMACVGYTAVTGNNPTPAVLKAAASLELFHAFALIHDDIMDGSDTRRGRPSLHRALADSSNLSDEPSAERDGVGRAILLGDLALMWSDEMLHSCGFTAAQRTAVRPVLDAMRTEVIGGQYLDLIAQSSLTADLDTALAVVRSKTAKYTVERPLHLGAALAGGTRRQVEELTQYAIPLGEAFQLRDDLLGVFGDPKVTGKSRLSDLREGKKTALIAIAHRDAAPAHRARLDALLGRPGLTEGEAEQIRNILTVCGARRAVEQMIADRCRRVYNCLDSVSHLSPRAVQNLRILADSAVRRTS
ncbi:polyprenyl synthetase family protein [Streptomyces sp. NPDC050625]|uniref:polyprenyl synthetase family protein n=1 Tax=Streptomyces sp. NPDC050625 TaxID=3154629 RepID=UPI003434085D